MATLRKRGTAWQVIVKRQGYPTQSRSFPLKSEAEKWGRQQERAMDAGTWLDRAEAEQTTLADLLDRYSKEVSPGKRGAEVEQIRLKALQRMPLAKYSAAAVTGTLIAKFRDERLKDVSTSTVTRELQLLSHVFAIAIKEWGFGLAANPVSLVKKPTPNRGRDRVLTPEERDCLLTACGEARNPWLRPALIFALETGARRGETLLLRWSEVDLIRRTARFLGDTTKTATERTIPLSPACITMLKTLPRSTSGYVFPLTASALQQSFERAVNRAGILNFVWHDCRHVALSNYAAMGLSILELKSISGHASTDLLSRYVAIDASALAKKIASA